MLLSKQRRQKNVLTKLTQNAFKSKSDRFLFRKVELYRALKLPEIIKRHRLESWKIFVRYRRVLRSHNIKVTSRVFSYLLKNYNSGKEKQDLAQRYLKHRSEVLLIRCFEAFSYFNRRLKGRIEKVRSYYGLKLKFNAFRTLKSSFV